MHAAPRDALVHFLERDVSLLRLDLAAHEFLLVEAGAGLDFLGLDRLAAERELHEFVGCEHVVAAQQQRVDRVGGGLRGLPVLRLLLFQEPHLAVLDRLRVIHHFVERLDHERLRLDRRAVPPPRRLGVAPEHPHLLILDGEFLDGFHDALRRRLVAEARERNREMSLRLAIQLQPELARLAEEVIHGLLVLRRDRFFADEKAAAIEVKRDRRAEVIVLFFAVLQNLAVRFFDPAVERTERLHRGRRVNFHAEMPQPAEARRDVERDVFVAVSAGEPRPHAVAVLHLAELAQQPRGLGVEPVVVEKDADILPRLALRLRLPHPRRLLKDHGLEVLIFLQRAVQRGRAFPLIEDAADFRIGCRDVPRERICVEPVERLLRAFMRELHEVRQRHHRIPRRIRHHLHREGLRLQRVRFSALDQLGEFKLLRLRSAHGQRQRLRHERAPREHREQPFLAVREPARGADRLVAQRVRAVGHLQLPREAARLARGHLEIQIRLRIFKLRIHRLACARIREREPHRALLARRRLVGHLHRELQRIALAQKARRIRLHHDLLRRDRLVLDEPRAQIAVVREAHEFPSRQRLGHGELHRHRAVLARDQVREKERRLVQIFPRGNLGEIGCGWSRRHSTAARFVGRLHFHPSLPERIRSPILRRRLAVRSFPQHRRTILRHRGHRGARHRHCMASYHSSATAVLHIVVPDVR